MNSIFPVPSTKAMGVAAARRATLKIDWSGQWTEERWIGSSLFMEMLCGER